MMPLSRLDCPLSLKTPNMGNTGLLTLDSPANENLVGMGAKVVAPARNLQT